MEEPSIAKNLKELNLIALWLAKCRNQIKATDWANAVGPIRFARSNIRRRKTSVPSGAAKSDSRLKLFCFVSTNHTNIFTIQFPLCNLKYIRRFVFSLKIWERWEWKISVWVNFYSYTHSNFLLEQKSPMLVRANKYAELGYTPQNKSKYKRNIQKG